MYPDPSKYIRPGVLTLVGERMQMQACSADGAVTLHQADRTSTCAWVDKRHGLAIKQWQIRAWLQGQPRATGRDKIDLRRGPTLVGRSIDFRETQSRRRHVPCLFTWRNGEGGEDRKRLDR